MKYIQKEVSKCHWNVKPYHLAMVGGPGEEFDLGRFVSG